MFDVGSVYKCLYTLYRVCLVIYLIYIYEYATSMHRYTHIYDMYYMCLVYIEYVSYIH